MKTTNQQSMQRNVYVHDDKVGRSEREKRGKQNENPFAFLIRKRKLSENGIKIDTMNTHKHIYLDGIHCVQHVSSLFYFPLQFHHIKNNGVPSCAPCPWKPIFVRNIFHFLIRKMSSFYLEWCTKHILYQAIELSIYRTC